MGTCGTDEAQLLIELPDTCRSPPLGSGREYALAVAAGATDSTRQTAACHWSD